MLKNINGKIGEEYVEKYLKKKRYTIISKNFHSRFGEIDIIAENSKYIVFVEVKAREEGFKVHPLQAVTKSKQQKIILTTQIYLRKNPTQKQPRFDVASVICKDNKPVKLDYIENAFTT